MDWVVDLVSRLYARVVVTFCLRDVEPAGGPVFIDEDQSLMSTSQTSHRFRQASTPCIMIEVYDIFCKTGTSHN